MFSSCASQGVKSPASDDQILRKSTFSRQPSELVVMVKQSSEFQLVTFSDQEYPIPSVISRSEFGFNAMLKDY